MMQGEPRVPFGVVGQPAATGHYCPPMARPPVQPVNEPALLKRQQGQPEDGSPTAKRTRMEGGFRGSSQAADELLGRSTNNQQGPCTDFASFLASRPRASTGRDVTTFADLAMTGASNDQVEPAVVEARKASLQALRIPSFTGRPPVQPDASMPPAEAGTSGQQGPQQQPLISVPHCLPYDWALKSLVRFTCSTRFTCYDASVSAPASHELPASVCLDRHQWRQLPVQVKWWSALSSYAHPSEGWEPEVVGALKASGPGSVVLQQRLDAWRQAFSTAYMTVRHGQCCAMYLESPKGCRQPCTILFTAAEARGCPQPQAFISSTSAQQRTRMQAAGLDLCMPLSPAAPPPTKHTNNKLDTGDADTAQQQQQQQTRSAPSHPTNLQVRDHSPQSLVVFTGPVAVHLLFDWLLSEVQFSVQQGGDTTDLPTILAPRPFQGACMSRPQIKSMSGVGLTSTADTTTTNNNNQHQHVLELSGVIPPWTLTRVCSVMAECDKTAGHTFQADLTTLMHSLSLNVERTAGPALAAATDAKSGCDGWGVVSLECAASCTGTDFLTHRVMRSVVVQVGESQEGDGGLTVTYKLRLSG